MSGPGGTTGPGTTSCVGGRRSTSVRKLQGLSQQLFVNIPTPNYSHINPRNLYGVESGPGYTLEICLTQCETVDSSVRRELRTVWSPSHLQPLCDRTDQPPPGLSSHHSVIMRGRTLTLLGLEGDHCLSPDRLQMTKFGSTSYTVITNLELLS